MNTLKQYYFTAFKNNYSRLLKLFGIFFCLVLLLQWSPSLHAQKKKKKHKHDKTDTLNMVMTKNRLDVQIVFMKGEEHKHPTFAIWSEDMDGKLLETLYVTQYFASGIFAYADAGEGTWKKESGESLRPAALPYWSHRRNIISRDTLYVPTPENPVPDAITGATPKGNFVMNSSVSKDIPDRFRIMFEINQPIDYNDYWTNNRFPGNYNYISSAQPSLIYAVDVDMNNIDKKPLLMSVIGHGHYAGDNGDLFTDVSTLSSALEIAKSINVYIK